MFPARLSMRQTAESIFLNTNKRMTDKNGSDFGAVLFFVGKDAGHKKALIL